MASRIEGSWVMLNTNLVSVRSMSFTLSISSRVMGSNVASISFIFSSAIFSKLVNVFFGLDHRVAGIIAFLFHFQSFFVIGKNRFLRQFAVTVIRHFHVFLPAAAVGKYCLFQQFPAAVIFAFLYHIVVRVVLVGHFVADRKSTRLNSSHSQISYAVF